MKKFVTVLAFIFCAASALAGDFDYEKTYLELEPADFTYVHDIDPDETWETRNSTWSPYPLFRLISPIYFKNITIKPGYYLLTPREQDGKWYILFKETGRVKYIIPCYNRDFTPEFFYDENLPKPKLSIGQALMVKTTNFFGRFCPSMKKPPIPSTYLEATDLDNHFLSLIIYWGEFRYYTIFRTIPL